jgi:hypothetical protein
LISYARFFVGSIALHFLQNPLFHLSPRRKL